MLIMGNGFYYNPVSGEILKDNEVIAKLTGIKSLILTKLLTDGVNTFVSKEELIKSTWGKANLVVTHLSLTQQMYLLRKALNKHGFQNYIIAQSKLGCKIDINKTPKINNIQKKLHMHKRKLRSLLYYRLLPSKRKIY